MNRSAPAISGITRLPDGGLHLTAAAVAHLTGLIAADGFTLLVGLLDQPQLPPSSESRGDPLGVAEDAALLGVSDEWARQLFGGGRLPSAHKDDRGAWRARRADVIAYRDGRDRERS
jgi:hypothetical protein